MRTQNHRSIGRHVWFMVLLTTFIAACESSNLPTQSDVGDPSFIILQDGANEGNPRFFWLPPLVPNQEFFGDLDRDLPDDVEVTACALVAVGDDDCDGEVEDLGIATLTGNHYEYRWRPDETGTFRVFVSVAFIELGSADLEIGARRRDGDFVVDRTVPLRMRIEEGALCAPPIEDDELATRDVCVVESIVATAGGTASTTTDSDVTVGVDVPPQPPTEPDFTLVVEECIDAAGAPTGLAIDIPTFGGCLDVSAVTASGAVVDLDNEASVFICINFSDLGGLPATQEHLLRVHREDVVGLGTEVHALPLAEDACPEPAGAFVDTNPATRLVLAGLRALRDGARAWLGPTPLQASSAVVINTFRGGLTSGFSRFQWALPSKMEILEGDGQTTMVGTQVPISPAVKVTDARDADVEGATVTFTVKTGGGSVVPVDVESDGDGIARLTSWTIGSAVGVNNNTVEASCFGCATPGELTDGPQLAPIFDPFTPLPLTPSPGGPADNELDIGGPVELLDGKLIFTASGRNMSVAGIGANLGTKAAGAIFASGDLSGSFTEVGGAAFNLMSVEDLNAAYDVLIFTWVSDPAINADWTTRLVPYMEHGGGILFEDPGNVGDLAPGVLASVFNASGTGIALSAVVPGLTDGITDDFENNHIEMGMNDWDARLSPFITRGALTVGLYGSIGPGCIVLTGPDQHFHGVKGSLEADEANQYNLLVNELEFVTDPALCP